MKSLEWSDDDDELLSILYRDNKMTLPVILDYFPNRSWSSLRCRVKTLGLSRYHREDKPLLGKHLVEDLELSKFFPLTNKINCYVYGLLCTDGCVMKNRLSYNSKDKELVDIVNQAFGVGRTYLKQNKSHQIWQYEYCRRRISDQFSKIGLPERKTKILEWKNTFERVPKEFQRDFIRGLWDGDGCIYTGKVPHQKGQRLIVTFCSASKNFIFPMMEFIKTNIVDTNSNVLYSKNSDLFSITFSYNKALEICNWMYFESCDLKLFRKYNKYIDYLKDG